uniref:Uncharacterized protein n=1 Tax=Cacopsylla melanoneura TaxID=428564 RepID=A0A8D8YMF7_9HEMI
MLKRLFLIFGTFLKDIFKYFHGKKKKKKSCTLPCIFILRPTPISTNSLKQYLFTCYVCISYPLKAQRIIMFFFSHKCVIYVCIIIANLSFVLFFVSMYNVYVLLCLYVHIIYYD